MPTGITAIAYINAKTSHQDEVRRAPLDLVAQTRTEVMRSISKTVHAASLSSLDTLHADVWAWRHCRTQSDSHPAWLLLSSPLLLLASAALRRRT